LKPHGLPGQELGIEEDKIAGEYEKNREKEEED
jgi:hypothetical protein